MANGINIVAEDILTRAVATRLALEFCPQIAINRVIVTHGASKLEARMASFARSAHIVPFFVLTDLDSTTCPPELIKAWLPQGIPPKMIFRIAVREVEAWLLADRSGLAEFLRIGIGQLPILPEHELDPKRSIVDAARNSSRAIREALVPRDSRYAPVGPEYNSLLAGFVENSWDPAAARKIAPSLDRAIDRIAAMRF